MAEFPDLGQNCSLSLCQVLDFTPYTCTLCRKTYCSQHRFSHGCELASQNSIQQVGPSAPVNVFLCSFRDCSNSEAVKIVCDHCKSNFCLKESTDRTEQVQKIREKLDLPQPTSQSQAPSTSVSTKKILTDEEQKRADKIALMKLKSRFAKGNNFGSDALIVFVKWNDVREPVQLNKARTYFSNRTNVKKWSIGKSVSEMISAVKAPQDSKARKSDIDSVLDFSLSTGDTLKEGDTICLCE